MTTEPWLMAKSVACAKKVAHPRRIEIACRFFCLSRISDFLPSLSIFRVFCCGLFFSPPLPPLDQESAALGANFSDDGCIISFSFGRVGFLFSLSLLASSPPSGAAGLRLLPHLAIILEGEVVGGKIPLCSALLWPFVTHVIYTSLLALTGLPLSVLLTPAVSKSNAKK